MSFKVGGMTNPRIIRLRQNKIWRILRFSVKLPIRQIKNLAKVSRNTVCQTYTIPESVPVNTVMRLQCNWVLTFHQVSVSRMLHLKLSPRLVCSFAAADPPTAIPPQVVLLCQLSFNCRNLEEKRNKIHSSCGDAQLIYSLS